MRRVQGTGTRKGHSYCVGQNGDVVGQDGRPDCREVVRRQYCELGRPPADGPLGQSRALVLRACAYLPEGLVAARAWAGVSQTSSRSSSIRDVNSPVVPAAKIRSTSCAARSLYAAFVGMPPFVTPRSRSPHSGQIVGSKGAPCPAGLRGAARPKKPPASAIHVHQRSSQTPQTQQ